MLIETGLPSPSTMLFNRQIRGLLPSMNRDPINVGNDLHHEALEFHERKKILWAKVLKKMLLFITGATVAVQ